MTSGIYQITNQTNGKCYIGSAVNLRNRWYGHLHALRHTRHKNPHLQSAFNKYGKAAFVFEVLERVEAENLVEREQHYLDTLNPEYNIARTAGSSLGCSHSVSTREKLRAINTGKHLSEKTRCKMSEARSGERHYFYGKHHSKKTRHKLSEAARGKHHSEETRAKMSLAQRARRLREREERPA